MSVWSVARNVQNIILTAHTLRECKQVSGLWEEVNKANLTSHILTPYSLMALGNMSVSNVGRNVQNIILTTHTQTKQ